MVESLKEVFEKKFKKHPVLGGLLQQKKILDAWEKIVGSKIAQVTEPVKFQKGVLTIAVPNPVWHQEINFLKEKIILGINQFLGVRYLKKINCQVVGEKEIFDLRQKRIQTSQISLPDWYIDSTGEKKLKSGFNNWISRITLMDEKLKKWRQKNKLKKCPICESFFYVVSKERFCPLCREREKRRILKKIYQLILKNPERKLMELKKFFPSINAVDFKKARQLVREEGEKIVRFFKRQPEKFSLKLARQFKEIIKAYLIIVSGKSPQELPDNLMKKILGDKIYYRLKNL